jgi:flavin reductase (DIM6/NTAB) family NADH-FMN oxidoreductase RutF
MKKELGVHPYLFPMPVLMIATYDKNGNVDVMNMAWGGICAEDMVALNISADHKTFKNIQEHMAFTLSVADTPHLKEADFFGTATGNTMEDKFQRSGLTSVKSALVDAPVIEEFPLTLECKVESIQTGGDPARIVGKIINVLADENVLDNNGNIDPSKLNAFVYDQFQNGYYAIGEKVGQAWESGASFMNK